MSFYDIDPSSLPNDSQFYHNVLVVLVGFPPEKWQFEEDEIWYLDHITSARPYAICFYVDEEFDLDYEEEDNLGDIQEQDFYLQFDKHSVVEVCSDNSIQWYPKDEGSFDLEEAWQY